MTISASHNDHRSSMRIPFLALALSVVCPWAVAEDYKKLPPVGIQLDDSVKKGITKRVGDLRQGLDQAARASKDADRWRPDVEVLIRAVALALEHNTFYKKSEVKDADQLLDEAQRRLVAAKRGDRGLRLLGTSEQVRSEPQTLVGGFLSRIDHSVQPFGLVVPAKFRLADLTANSTKHRLDVWLHGRGDTKTEIPFLKERMTQVGLYSPANTFVLHPFGRHCNAFKFAGETDVYEAMAHVGTLLEIDARRVAIRGFSMGGAGVWHLAVHDPARWFAANPGAGFVDSIVYQGWDKKPPFEFNDVRKKLLKWYDVLPWATNLRGTNLVAYSGEVDKQRQAAERVIETLKQENIRFEHVIGEKMAHKVDPTSVLKVDALLEDWQHASDTIPRKQIDFVTYHLRYHQMDWLSVQGLKEQFVAGRVKAEIASDDSIDVTTSGVTRLRLNFSESGWPGDARDVNIEIDGQTFQVADQSKSAGFQCELYLNQQWQVEKTFDSSRLRKRPHMQGPIDDAFCDRFVFVVPSRPATHGKVQRWIDREIKYARDRWKTLMRGEVRWVKDTDVTEQHIAQCNLICFGDFTGNRYLAGIQSRLPIGWTKEQVTVADRQFDPTTHAAVLCFPNPKNPKRYVVVNSGMTYREFSNVSNSRQIAMLPDWAVIEVSDEEDGIFPGKIADQGFFDEQWKLQP